MTWRERKTVHGDHSGVIAQYPMVEEAEATGVVAAVYARLLDDMPFVPSLFKSLALCPGYLLLAYEQAAPVQSGPEFGSLADGLAHSVRDAATPPPEQQVQEALAQFVGPLSRMLLLAARTSTRGRVVR